MKYQGGKGRLLPWLMPLLTIDGVYSITEPFCGSAVVGRHHPATSKVLNDENPSTVALLMALQDPVRLTAIVWDAILAIREGRTTRKKLEEKIRQHWDRVPIDLSWLIATYSYKGGGSRWFTGFSKENWNKILTVEKETITRKILQDSYGLQGDVLVTCQKAEDLLGKLVDQEFSLLYFDPPYLGRKSRDSRHNQGETRFQYACEMLDTWQHEKLLACAREFEKAAIAISHTPHPLYDGLKAEGWVRVDQSTFDGSRQQVTESLYLNPSAASRLPADLLKPPVQKSLF